MVFGADLPKEQGSDSMRTEELLKVFEQEVFSFSFIYR